MADRDIDRQRNEEHYAFWADEVADRIEGRNPEEPIVIKGGVSPSGVPHLGHFNEIMRGHYVAEVLRERGHEVRQVFTSDDRDALRKLPRTLADNDWNLVGLSDVNASALGENLGIPYTGVPDPFGKADSYGEHFTSLLEKSATLADIDIDVLSMTRLYESGAFDDAIYQVLSNPQKA
ncbi:MAG: lysine--tRNA ligase, partial [Halobacteriaceae archaeon]